MHSERTLSESDFPRFGARARRWRRFEDELRLWLATPEGTFATWRARRDLAESPAPAPPALSPPPPPGSGTRRTPR